jgi:hypothetical protein
LSDRSRTEINQIFALKVQRNRLLDICSQFIQRGCLFDYGEVEAFGNELVLSSGDSHLNLTLHRRSIGVTAI